MPQDYKPVILIRHDLLTPEERKDELRLIEERALEEGRPSSEIFRTAMVRMNFAEMGKGDFFDEKLVESRENGEDFKEFIHRMNRTYRTH